MTSPAASTSGPPELPGLIAASVWIALMKAGAARVAGGDGAVERADDAGGHRPGQAERGADRDDGVADDHRVRVAEAQRRQAVDVDLEHGQVVVRGAADDGRVGFSLPSTNVTVIVVDAASSACAMTWWLVTR